MKELDKHYFSKISELVNSELYNSANFDSYIKKTYIGTINEEHVFSQLRSDLKAEGFAIAKIKASQKYGPELIGEWLEKLLAASPLVDKNPGELSYAKIQVEESSRHYVTSNLSQPLHTDQGHTTQCPRYVALYCFSQATSGGYSIVVQFEELYKQLINQFGDLVDLLFIKDAVTVQNMFRELSKPILIKLEDGKVGISYSPVLQKMYCSDQIFQLFDFITSYVHNPINQIRLKLKENQILLLDNCLCLHGRTGFSNNGARLLYRYWFGNRHL
jgi:hypothetical protein